MAWIGSRTRSVGYFLCNSLRYSGIDLLNATVARGVTCFCLLY